MKRCFSGAAIDCQQRLIMEGKLIMQQRMMINLPDLEMRNDQINNEAFNMCLAKRLNNNQKSSQKR